MPSVAEYSKTPLNQEILGALRAGAITSKAIADRTDLKESVVHIHLWHLYRRGYVRRGPYRGNKSQYFYYLPTASPT